MSPSSTLVAVITLSLCSAGCLLGWGSGTEVRECESSTCGCFDKKQMTFTGYVMDGVTHECIQGKLVRLRADRTGAVVSEDTSKSFGGYQVSGEVERSPRCQEQNGQPVIRDEPEAGSGVPTYVYLPRFSPVDDSSEKVDLFRFPFGTTDAGTGHPDSCLPPRRDGGMADGG